MKTLAKQFGLAVGP